MMKIPAPLKQRGYLMIAALLIILIFGSLAAALTHFSLSGIHAQISHQSHHKATLLAKSAIEQGLADLTVSQAWCDGLQTRSVDLAEGRYDYQCQHYGPNTATLSQDINATQTSLPLDSTALLAPFGFVFINDEIISYEQTDAHTLLNVKRGESNTTATAAANGQIVLQDQYVITAKGRSPNPNLPRGQLLVAEVVRLIRDASGYVAVGQKNNWGKILTFSHGKWAVTSENNNMGYYAVSFVDNDEAPTQVAAGFRINIGEIHGQAPWQEMPLTSPHSNRIQFLGLSCRYANSCWAVGLLDPPGKPKEAYGVFYRYENGNWIQRATTPAGTTLQAIDCPSAQLCYAVTAEGRIYRRQGLNSVTWEHVATVAHQPTLSAISCPNTFTCFITSTQGQLFSYNGLIQTIATLQPAIALRAIYCVDANQCVIGGDKGWMARLKNGSLQTEATPGKMDIRGLYCLAADDCMAVGLKSNVSYRYSDQIWSPYTLGGQYDLYAISAPKSATQSLTSTQIALVFKHYSG